MIAFFQAIKESVKRLVGEEDYDLKKHGNMHLQNGKSFLKICLSNISFQKLMMRTKTMTRRMTIELKIY